MSRTAIKSKVLSGLKWNTISVFGTRGTDFIVKLILARFVLPDAYGLVGMAMMIIGFLTVVSDMGLFTALVQKKEDELTDVRYSSAFWYLLGLASVFTICFFLFISPLGASFYNEPRLIPVLNSLGFYLFFNILNIIPRVILTRKLDFRSLVRITFLGTTLSSVLAIITALLGFGVWSLVLKSLVSAFTIFISYWTRVGWRPKFVFNYSVLKDLAGYSTYTQVNAILFYFRNNLDYLIIGKLVSAHLLGVYTLAFTLSENMRAQLYSIFNKVFFPIYSKIQDDIEQIRDYYLKVMRLTAIVTFPISILFISLSTDIILVFWGKRWIETAEPLSILAVASMIFAISGTPSEVLKSIGKASVGFYLNLINTFVIAFPLIYFGQKYYGLAGVAYAVCIHYTVSRLTYHHYMKKYINITDKDITKTLRMPVLAAMAMLGSIYLVKILALPHLENLILSTLVGCIIYGFILLRDLKKGLKLVMDHWVYNVFKPAYLMVRKDSYVYNAGRRTFKLFILEGKESKLAEVNGNKKAQDSIFWSDQVVKVKHNLFFLAMQKGIPMAVAGYDKAEHFVKQKMLQAKVYPIHRASLAFDFNRLRKLESYGLKPGLMESVEEILKPLLLPMTSAHGDLHIDNMICIADEVKVIDWSMYNEYGTFITDYIHFYNYRLAAKNKESWTRAIVKDQSYLKHLANEFDTTPDHLRLIYTVARISGETTQSRALRHISKRQIEKYNYVLNYLVNEFNKPEIQYCNTAV